MQNSWTQDRDYALAFGAALGMSASQIAQSFGGITRNSVIGRCHRLNIGLGGKRRSSAAAAPASSPVPRAPRQRGTIWTAEQDDALRIGVAARRTSKELADELGHTVSAVTTRRQALGLTLPWRRFTAEEDEIIRADYAAYIPVGETARKVGRSWGTVRQRILQLGIGRDARKTRLAARFGAEVLLISDDPREIRRQLQEAERRRQAELEAANAARIEAALMEMSSAIHDGESRAVAFKAAMLQGATLQQIGDRVSLTRERIRQIVSKPPVPVQRLRTIVCRRCQNDFQTAGSGDRRYCVECRPIVEENNRIKARAYQSDLRKSEAHRQYRRDWTRRDRLKKKLADLPPSELATMLRQLANDVSCGDAS